MAEQGGTPAGESGRIPEWLLERLVAGDLPAAQAARIRAQLEERGELARASALAESNRAILEAHPPALVAAEVHRRLTTAAPARARASARRWWGSLALGGAAAALLLLPLLPWPLLPWPSAEPAAEPTASGAEGVRLKGLEPHLVLYKKTVSGAVRLHAPARAAPGDVVQLAYVAAGRRYGAIASIDSTGAVTLHLPESGGAAVPLAPQSETPLPHAFELDHAPGSERFLFVTADRPFDAGSLTSALREGAALPADLTTHLLQLEKNSHE